MEDWCTLMTLPLSDVQRPMGSKFTNCFIVSMSSRDFGWGVSEQEQQQRTTTTKKNMILRARPTMTEESRSSNSVRNIEN